MVTTFQEGHRYEVVYSREGNPVQLTGNVMRSPLTGRWIVRDSQNLYDYTQVTLEGTNFLRARHLYHCCDNGGGVVEVLT
jgi:hypothetical protein